MIDVSASDVTSVFSKKLTDKAADEILQICRQITQL